MAYIETFDLAQNDLTFQGSFSAAGTTLSQIYGFDSGDPIRFNYSIPTSDGMRVYAYAMVPIGYANRPNVNSSGTYKCIGNAASKVSYLEWTTNSASIDIEKYHVPPIGMGIASYGYTLSGSKNVGSTYIEFDGPALWALADFWYPNNEHITEYSEAGIKLKFSSVTVKLYRTELKIAAYPSEGIAPLTVSFYAEAKDGVPPYTFFWDFGNGASSAKDPVYTFYEPGTYNVSCRVTDSLGVSDEKSLVIKVNMLTLIIETEGTGTTNPPSGQYLKKLGEQVQVTAIPGQGCSLDLWMLDGVPSGSQRTFNVIMNANHTLKAKFTSGLQVAASAHPTEGYPPLNVTFVSSTSGGTPPYSYSWDFGDFGISNLQNPYHVYSQPGSYVATVVVLDSGGRKGVAEAGPINVLSTFDFTITKERDIALRPGESSSTRIYVNSSATLPISLSIEWFGSVPAGSMVQISPSSSLTNFTSILSISTSPYTPAGDYICLVRGTFGNLTRSVEVWIRIYPTLYILDLRSGDGGTTCPEPGIYHFLSGQDAVIEAIPDNDHQFNGWELDGSPCGSANPLTLPIYSNHTLKADFVPVLKPPQSTVTLDIRYWDGYGWKVGEYYPYGLVNFSGYGWVLGNPTTYPVNIGDVVGIQFIPRNRDGLMVDVWGGSPIGKIFSSYYTSGTTRVEISPSTITYPNSQELYVTSPSPYLMRINLKWVDYPISIHTETPTWGRVVVISSSPSLSLYNQDPTSWGTYFIDYGYDVTIKAQPYSGYYLDKIIVDGKIHYSEEVTIFNVVEPHDVTVCFTAVLPTFTLKITATEGGITMPSPGTYALPRYTSQSVKALVTDERYYFSSWIFDGIPSGNAETFSIYMDSDHELSAVFDTDYMIQEGINVAPCDLLSGTMFKKVILGEFIGVNVTGRLAGVTSPTQVTVTAWLDCEGASYWDFLTNRIIGEGILKLEGNTTTNASGWFTIKFGSLENKCWVAKGNPGLYLAHAEVRNATSQSVHSGTWRSENVTTMVEFDYDVTGTDARFSMMFADGSPVKNREGEYIFGFKEWDLGLSSPIDNNGTATLRISYQRLANTPFLQGNLTTVLYTNSSGQPSAVTWYRGNPVRYTEISPQFLMHNETFLLLEVFDWGSPYHPDLGGATAYLWLNSPIPWDGSMGILFGSPYGPSMMASIERSGNAIFATDPSGCLWKIDDKVRIPQGVVRIDSALFITHPPLKEFLNYHKGDIYLTLVPPHSTNVLYSPAKGGILLLAASLAPSEGW